ncbi:MAG: glycosyltransferase [bacterium]
MIKNRVFIVFGDDWGRYPTTLQHIMKRFLPNNKFIWIGSLGLRKPKLKIADIFRIIEKINKFIKKEEKNTREPNITVLHPFIFPFHNFSFFRNLNKRTLIKKIKQTLFNLNYKDPIIITTQPIIGDVLNNLGEKSSHYFCQDDYTQFEGAYKIIDKLEKEMLKKISTCFAVAQHLMETRIPANGNVFYLPQGVDTSHFKLIKTKNVKPTIGFFGLLSPEWINLQLLLKVVKRYPEYDFLLIGRTTFDNNVFEGFHNLKYIGEVPYKELPTFAEKFTVGLIPFPISGLTKSCNPLKLLEYFALGLPVVSTNIPAVNKFKDFLFIGQTEEDFINLIPKAILANNEQENFARRNIAEKYSWQSIAENISAEIETFENLKN